MPNPYIGEFEQMVLLAIIQSGNEPYAPNIRKVLVDRAGRSVSRGALYRTFDRLAAKGCLQWEIEDSNRMPERGGAPMRLFSATPEGRRALRVSREALMSLWDGIEGELEHP